jgi:transposase-like protein
MRRTREQWAALVATFERTGLSVERFCAPRGIAPPTLRWWRWQLRDTGEGRRRAHNDTVRLLSVDVADERRAARSTSHVSIVLSDVEVRVDVGADVEYVAALVARLRRA